MFVNGDKLVVKKNVMGVLNEGDIVKVIDVGENGLIKFAFGENFMHMGLMTSNECEEHFEKIVTTEVQTVPWELIEEILDNSDFHAFTTFDKCTTVSCLLPNGYVITESNICTNPEHYDEETEFGVCWEKIADKLYELETYRLHCEEHHCDCDCCYEDEFDECLDTDLDCDDCDDYDCPNNSNRLFS